jgi:hypothetical protein
VRGKDDGKPALTDQNPTNLSVAPQKDAQTLQSLSVTGPLKRSQRQIKKRRLLVLRLAAIGFDADQIQQALASQAVDVTARTVYRDLAALRKQLDVLDRKQLGYTLGFSFAELEEMWREGWISYHKPDTETGFLKLGALRELLQIHRAKTRLAGLDIREGTEATAFVTPSFRGVKITTSMDIDDIVREGGIEYAASKMMREVTTRESSQLRQNPVEEEAANPCA